MTSTLSETNKNTPRRVEWLDVLRGIAVLWMIEVHLLDVGLMPILKQGWGYGKIDFYNGTVAPIFLFCAGASFWIACQNGKTSQQAGAYLKRLAFILFIAYWLNLPYLSFKHCLDIPLFSKNLFFASDILHTIVLSSLFAFIALRSKRSETKFLIFCMAWTLLVYWISPWVWNSELYKKLPLPLGLYFAPAPLSKFSLFPWMGHFFAGLSLVGFYQKTQKKLYFGLIVLLISLASPTLIFFIKNFYTPSPTLYQNAQWWHVSPGHSLLRLSRVTLFFSLISLYNLRFPLRGKISSFLKNIGRESLFYYVTHIAILYGTVVNKGLRAFGYGAWNWLGVLILYLFLIAFLYPMGQAWHEYKKNSPQQLKRILCFSFLLFALLFFMLP
ncbi:MAG: DUF1624 domain-containing protein [Deltaproteobacteria bacterium]|nr:DUF1624 domain-containing protein [Deltaproteobacteria bacterium]